MSHDFTRRSFLAAAGASATAFGIGGVGARQEPAYTLALTQDGWVGQAPSEIEGQNSPTLNFDPGQEVSVRWTNQTDILHNFSVTQHYPAGDAQLRSNYVPPGESQTVTFTAQEGLTAYYCENHLDEMGNIVVGEGQQTTVTTQDVEVDHTAAASVPFQTFRFVGSTAGWQAQAPSSIQGETNPTLRLVPGRLYAIHWLNGDGAPHNVEIKNDRNQELVRSDITARGGARQTVKFLATENMTEYYCQYHPLRMSGDLEMVSEDQVTQQTTAPQETTAPGQTTAAGQTTAPNASEFEHHTVSRDITEANATQTTTAAPATQTTTVGNQTAAADANGLVRTLRGADLGALTAFGGIGGAMSYLLSDDDGEE